MQLLTVPQAASRLGLRESTLRFWIWTRKIDYVKVGRAVRVSTEMIDALIEAGTVPARKPDYGRGTR
jgi:excisionase family DNA binding protein